MLLGACALVQRFHLIPPPILSIFPFCPLMAEGNVRRVPSLCRNMNVISCTKVTLLFNLSNMFTIILLMAAGALTGHLLRHIRLLRQVEKSASLTVFALLFVLGLSIGSNQLIIENLDRFGWQAAVLATAGTAGSILAAALVVQLFFNKKKEKKA